MVSTISKQFFDAQLETVFKYILRWLAPSKKHLPTNQFTDSRIILLIMPDIESGDFHIIGAGREYMSFATKMMYRKYFIALVGSFLCLYVTLICVDLYYSRFYLV